MDKIKVFSVSELTELVKSIVEENFQAVRVEGEISNYRPAPSGHLYFTLKDQSSMVQAVMFRGKATQLDFLPADGMLVKITGSLSVYSARGQYQLVCDKMELAGSGEILAMLEERKRKLADEGLFDEMRKRSLPVFPERVVVITSPTGAAIRDILNVIKRRNSSVNIIILPASVQGENSPSELIEQVKTANEFQLGDVIIIGRGGGAIEDLLSFSDEELVREVAASKIPVISAVGHEIDWSLIDFAADVRAPTPSAAAELVCESTDTFLAQVSHYKDSFIHIMISRLELAKSWIKQFSAEGMEFRLRRIMQSVFQRFDDAKETILNTINDKLNKLWQRFELVKRDIDNANPAAILARGFSVVTNLETNAIIRDAASTFPGEKINIKFAKGSAHAIVEEKADEEI